ncbi:HAD family hydrolase [Thalassovita gelatinovora]|nr:HAD family hydrolase [Thalassovita gelatinovora]
MTSFVDCLTPIGIAAEAAKTFFLTLVGTSVSQTDRMLAAFLGDAGQAEFIAQQWNAHFDQRLQQNVPVKATVRATLAELTAAGAQMAVVTSTKGARARHHLHQAGLLGHFKFVLGGDEVSANKPDPAPYREAAARLGFDPKRCAAFEDSDRGIMAAMAAGCHAVQIPDLRPVDQALPQLGQLLAEDLARAVALVQNRSPAIMA